MVWTITGKGGVVKSNPYNPITHSIHVGHVDLHYTIHGSYAGKYLDEKISQDVGPSTAGNTKEPWFGSHRQESIGRGP